MADDPWGGADLRGEDGGLFNTTVSGTGTVALCTVGHPVVLDCSQQPTYVDVQACVAWSANLVPDVVSSMSSKSMLRGGFLGDLLGG